MTYFIDANVPIYAAGRPSEFRGPSGAILDAVADGLLLAATDVEVIQEIAHHYSAIRETSRGVKLARLFAGVVPLVLPIEPTDALAMLDALASHAKIGPRDALHYAVMQRHSITHIITADVHFDALPGITRIDPRQADEILA
jgi:uncharacterized protein